MNARGSSGPDGAKSNWREENEQMRENRGRRRGRAYPALDGEDGNQLGGMWRMDGLDGWTLDWIGF